MEVSRTDLDMRPHVPYTEHWPTVRLAIVGLGLVGRRHADAIDTADGIDLCAVVDPDESACDLAAARSVPCFGNLNEMIAAKKPDGIILSTPTALLQQRLARIPLGFMGDGRDTANAVLFLASDEARFITGTEIVVDGGMSVRCD